MHEDEEYVLPMVSAGAAGYLLKNSAAAELLAAVLALPAGKRLLRPAGGACRSPSRLRHPGEMPDDPYGG